MAFSKSLRYAVALAILAVAVAVGANGASAQQSRPSTAADVNIPLRDARGAGANSVRFAAAQLTKDAPAAVIFGVTKENWPRLRGAMQQAVFNGYPIAGVLIGPAEAGPALEIYAKGHHVTKPINPDAITSAELTRLIRDVSREYYGR